MRRLDPDRLAGLEEIVGAGRAACLEVGRALAEIRDDRRYGAAHTSWMARRAAAPDGFDDDDQDDVRALATEQLEASLAIVHPGLPHVLRVPRCS
jgi:hypothetical protein